MDSTYLKARAKINIALDVLGKRDDGYHEMRMIMQTLHFHDGVYIKKIDKPLLKLSCNIKWLPIDNRNLIYQTAEFLIKQYNIQNGVFIELHKYIPVSAGLGGGSSDCAATLVGMRKLFKLPITDDELFQIGKQFGADVPYCIQRGTVLAEGIGEKLTTITPSHPDVFVVVARPPIRVSTAMVFSKFKLEHVTKRPNIEKMIADIQQGSIADIAGGFCNVLESVTENMYPVITDIKEVLLACHAAGVLMSGSGPTVFGYFKNKADAVAAMNKIKTDMPQIREIFLTSIFNPVSS